MKGEWLPAVVKALKHGLKDLPDPSVTLVGKKWKSPYLVLVACLLSLRTKDAVTLLAAQRLFELALTPQAMLALPVSCIERAIYPVGFYRTKAQRILDISHDIVYVHGGLVPDTLDGLLVFKGVGRKTANLVMVEGFGKPGICVDTHVHRITNRWGYVSTVSPDATETVLRSKLPVRYWKDINWMLVLWGQHICTPVSPRCSACAVKVWCRKVGVRGHR